MAMAMAASLSLRQRQRKQWFLGRKVEISGDYFHVLKKVHEDTGHNSKVHENISSYSPLMKQFSEGIQAHVFETTIP